MKSTINKWVLNAMTNPHPTQTTKFDEDVAQTQKQSLSEMYSSLLFSHFFLLFVAYCFFAVARIACHPFKTGALHLGVWAALPHAATTLMGEGQEQKGKKIIKYTRNTNYGLISIWCFPIFLSNLV